MLSALLNKTFLSLSLQRNPSKQTLSKLNSLKDGASAHGAMDRRIDPIDLFLVPASAPRLVYQMPWYVLSCLWDGAYKRTLAANRQWVSSLANKYTDT